jgi:glucose/mannose-6-phosphate isomerase
MARSTTYPASSETAWELGSGLPLPDIHGVQRVLIAGMGGSAIGADLVVSYVEPQCKLPLFLVRDYKLPAWASGPETMVIASSHSGNTEETLEAFAQALHNGCRLMAFSTGGKLARLREKQMLPSGCLSTKANPERQSVSRLGYCWQPSTVWA